MSEAGLKVNDTPKIHVENPQVEDHSIYFPKEDVRIPMELSGIFSCFPTCKPSAQDLEECENVLTLTPDGAWDPHNDAFARNEMNMLDSDGNMIEEKHRIRILLSEIPEDASLNNECLISKLEATSIDKVFEDRPPLTLAHELSSLMIERNNDAQFMASIGATHPCLVKTSIG